jgi:CelD/BcsL family acetyltransferase involved in cellulose biosynthesis
MSATVTGKALADLNQSWQDSHPDLVWPAPFVLPAWLDAWWRVFVEGSEAFIREVREGDKTIGLAPLLRRGDTALFLGGTDVCDYQDFIVLPGQEGTFSQALLDDMKRQGIRRLDLGHLRPDAAALIHLAPLARERGCEIATEQEAVSLEVDLPPTWEEYLALLSSKQRHEVRRKLRRLAEAGEVDFRFLEGGDATGPALDTFLEMFAASRPDKAAFLTEKIETFFREMAAAMTRIGRLRLGVLALDGRPVAEIICFDYNDCVYLYNSGYDPDYTAVSAGLLSKVMAIEDAVKRGRKRFDFLKGAEAYKYQLGGQEVPLYRCRIDLKDKS